MVKMEGNSGVSGDPGLDLITIGTVGRVHISFTYPDVITYKGNLINLQVSPSSEVVNEAMICTLLVTDI